MKNTRFKVTLFMLAAWFVLGVYAIHEHISLTEMAAYFGAGSVFVSTYIIGHSIRGSNASNDSSK